MKTISVVLLAGVRVMENPRPMWERVNEDRFVRIDNAVVMWDNRSPYPNPLNPKAKMWTAWEPGEPVNLSAR